MRPASAGPLRGASGLWVLLAVQGLCAVYFSLDMIADILGLPETGSLQDHDGIEYVITAALVLCLALTVREMRRLTARQVAMEAGLKAASGAFAEMLGDHFAKWSLTPTERDVALLALKGFSLAEIADIRGRKEGTVKAQLAAVYRKSGVTGRPQLLSLFIEELLDGPLPQPRATADQAPA